MRILLCKDTTECSPVEVFFSGEPWNPSIKIVAFGNASSWTRGTILEILRARFNWRLFEERARKIEALSRVISMFPGVRPGRCLSLYNALVDVVVKQRIALRLALNIYSRLVRTYGLKRIVGGRDYYSHYH